MAHISIWLQVSTIEGAPSFAAYGKLAVVDVGLRRRFWWSPPKFVVGLGSKKAGGLLARVILDHPHSWGMSKSNASVDADIDFLTEKGVVADMGATVDGYSLENKRKFLRAHAFARAHPEIRWEERRFITLDVEARIGASLVARDDPMETWYRFIEIRYGRNILPM